ncbi:MAG: hypothetical protein QXL16_01255 [Candidatus Micrarchaeaceae archaeon]
MIIEEVVALAAAYVSLSTIIQNKVANKEKMDQLNNVVKEALREMKEKGSKNYQPSPEQQKAMVELSKMQIKTMYILIPFSLFFYFIVLPFAFPSNPSVVVFSIKMNYRYLFIISSFIMSIVFLISFSLYKKLKGNYYAKTNGKI